MESRIQILPEHVANQIAAGEVVERPASVVKELVENALDAGALRVRVELEDGGKGLIRVLDDGCGMSPEDARKALQRHATSKVRTSEDLQRIGSLGFRGEALPSIQSVSRFALRTRPHDADWGVRIVAGGAGEPTVEPAGGPPGTEVVVEDLFFNVPARRKFLRRSGTEMTRIRTLVDQLALGWPAVHFALLHNGRKVLDYPADTDLRARILAVLGRKECRSLYPVKLEMGQGSVSGYASDPAGAQRTPNKMFTYVNGRFIRDRVVQHAVTQAYSELLERGQYPVCVLYVSVPPDAVDVNVHPAKAEVRFVESGAVHSLVERALRLTLAAAPWGAAPPLASPRRGAAGANQELPLSFGGSAGLPAHAPAALDTMAQSDEASRARLSGASPPAPARGVEPPGPLAPGPRPPLSQPAPAPGAPSGLTTARIIGRLGDRLLLAEVGRSLAIVDTVAAHERFLCDELLVAVEGKGAPSQRLLFPMQVTLERALAGVAEAESAELLRWGFECEHFGELDFLLTAIPALLRDRDPVPGLRAALAGLACRATAPAIAADLARAAAIRPGAELPSPLEKAILGWLGQGGAGSGAEVSPAPDGRRIAHVLAASEMDRWFGR